MPQAAVAFASPTLEMHEDGPSLKSAQTSSVTVFAVPPRADVTGVTFDVGLAAYLVDVEKIKDLTSLAELSWTWASKSRWMKWSMARAPSKPCQTMSVYLNTWPTRFRLDQAVALWTQELDDLGMTQLYQDMEFLLAQVLTDMRKR